MEGQREIEEFYIVREKQGNKGETETGRQFVCANKKKHTKIQKREQKAHTHTKNDILTHLNLFALGY